MSRSRGFGVRHLLGTSVLSALFWSPQAPAAIPVVDAGAIAQLVSQVENLHAQLEQAQEAFTAMTGGRGMEQLLEGLVRNYLPADWAAIEGALDLASDTGELAREIRNLAASNAVLTAQHLATLSDMERQQVEAARRSVALLQVMARDALEVTSARFDSIQDLIDTIPDAEDQKGILDLQARIAAEQGMLQNESTKLDILFQTAQAEEWSRRQRAREEAIVAIGSLRELPPMGLEP